MSSVERDSHGLGRSGSKGSFEDIHVENHEATPDAGEELQLSSRQALPVPDNGLKPTPSDDENAPQIIVTEEDVSQFKKLTLVCSVHDSLRLSGVEQAHSEEDRSGYFAPDLLDISTPDPRQISHQLLGRLWP